MLIPVKPSKALQRARRTNETSPHPDLQLEVIPFRNPEDVKVGRAKVTGRTVILNRKGP